MESVDEIRHLMARDWTQEEVEATVADYFVMLQSELRGERYNKSEHRRTLQRFLLDRSDTAIERKHMNISAVLRDVGHPWIDGYKPYGNYQRLLMDVVVSRLDSDRELAKVVEHDIDAPATLPYVDSVEDVWQTPPESDQVGLVYEVRPRLRPRTARNVNYLQRETRNRSLGLAGEEYKGRAFAAIDPPRCAILARHRTYCKLCHSRGYSSAGRALQSHCRGQRFDSA